MLGLCKWRIKEILWADHRIAGLRMSWDMNWMFHNPLPAIVWIWTISLIFAIHCACSIILHSYDCLNSLDLFQCIPYLRYRCDRRQIFHQSALNFVKPRVEYRRAFDTQRGHRFKICYGLPLFVLMLVSLFQTYFKGTNIPPYTASDHNRIFHDIPNIVHMMYYIS